MSAPPEVQLRPGPARGYGTAWPAAFLDQAERLGHSADALLAGRTEVGYPVIDSVAAARDLMPLSAAQRRRRQSIFFAPEIALRRSIGQGVHDRLEAAVFADGEIDPTDETGANRHFPFPAKATSVLSRTVAAGECWDVSVRGAEFGLDDLDDLLVLVNVGELVLEPGAQLAVQGNLLVLVVQRLVVRAPAGGSDDFHLGILPTPFSVDPRRHRTRAPDGIPGLPGIDGADGRVARTTPTFVGPRLLQPPVPGAEDGRPGTDGTAGTDGRPGASGGPSKLADLYLADIVLADGVGAVVVRAGAGRGLPGGAGGHGGDGGRGGDGAPAVRAVAQRVPAGHGGGGGDGGDGGRGAPGGSGGISSNVFLTVPPDQAGRVDVRALESTGGRGGRGGRGGPGGIGGSGGIGGAGVPDAGAGRDGRNGRDGRDGDDGKDGRSRPAPPTYINEISTRSTRRTA